MGYLCNLAYVLQQAYTADEYYLVKSERLLPFSLIKRDDVMKIHFLKRSFLSLLCLIIVPACVVSPAAAVQYNCEETPSVSISAPNDEMVDYACEAAGRALTFLADYELYPLRPIAIEIITKLIYVDGYWAFGLYDRQSDRLLMMSLPALLQTSRFPEMYNQPFDEEHYVGAIAHEITHAIFHHNAVQIEDKWNNAAHEYLAHATQLGVLSEQRRKEIIKSEDTGPWESGDDISVTYMGFNPRGFAVKSYLHLTQMAEPQTFIEILLNHKWIYVSVP